MSYDYIIKKGLSGQQFAEACALFSKEDIAISLFGRSGKVRFWKADKCDIMLNSRGDIIITGRGKFIRYAEYVAKELSRQLESDVFDPQLMRIVTPAVRLEELKKDHDESVITSHSLLKFSYVSQPKSKWEGYANRPDYEIAEMLAGIVKESFPNGQVKIYLSDQPNGEKGLGVMIKYPSGIISVLRHTKYIPENNRCVHIFGPLSLKGEADTFIRRLESHGLIFRYDEHY